MALDPTSPLQRRLDEAVSRPPGIPGCAAVVTGPEGVRFEGSAGLCRIGAEDAFTPDTVIAVHSATKAVTGAVCLQLMEDGTLDLDAPAREYVPDIGGLGVLDGFDEVGVPRTRPPRRDVTTRMLLLHRGGFGYDFFNADTLAMVRGLGLPDVATATRASITLPHLFDPGERWEYGTGIDWAGLVAEAAAGRRLGDLMAERIFDPLGMERTGFIPSEQMLTRRALIHARLPDGSLKVLPSRPMLEPEVHMGGQGLYSTATDYSRFVRMWLSDGAAPDGTPVLRPDTVAMAARGGLGGELIHPLPSVIPAITRPAEFFPGIEKSWALSFMVNEQDAPTGRRAGSLAWAGLANVYYWIDRTSGVGGVWATQVLPFFDEPSITAYLAFETEVYAHTDAVAGG